MCYITIIGEYAYHITGDTNYTEEVLGVEADVFMMPIDGIFNMSPTDAVQLIKDLKHKPSLVIPYHFGNEKFDTIFNTNTKKQKEIFLEEINKIEETKDIKVMFF